MKNYRLIKRDAVWVGEFHAMASPCEVLIDSTVESVARLVTETVMQEAVRIEHTFSRYRQDNIIHTINNSAGKPISVDAETAGLLDFCDQCFQISDGLFDITSGVLRKAWHFDGSDNLPTQSAIDKLLPLVGWQQLSWKNPVLCLPQGMQIDLGGVGKEYAVDRAVTLATQLTNCALLVNFGGDLHASGAPADGSAWSVGIEHVKNGKMAESTIQLSRGALTTSGDAHRFLQANGIRYGHVLNPKTGWPATGAPHAITVASNSCTQAGILSTLAMLHGVNAEQFLDQESVHYWCQR